MSKFVEEKWLNLGTLKKRKWEIVTKKKLVKDLNLPKIPKIVMPSYEDKVQKWLDSPIDYEEDEWFDENAPIRYKPPFVMDESAYYCYYLDSNDQDVKASREDLINLVDDNKESNPDDFDKDNYYSKIDDYIERYEGSSFRVLIPPNTKRYHTNTLLKNILDHCDNEDFQFNLIDTETNEPYTSNYLDSGFKDVFYEFCYANTHKSPFFDHQ